MVLLPTGAVGGGAEGAEGAAAVGAGADGRGGGAPGTAGRGAPARGTVGAPGRGGATGGRGGAGAAAGSSPSPSAEATGACGLSVMRTVSFFSGAAGGLMGGRGGVGAGAGLGFSGSCIGNFSNDEIHPSNGSFAPGCQHLVTQKTADDPRFCVSPAALPHGSSRAECENKHAVCFLDRLTPRSAPQPRRPPFLLQTHG
jgi:hypothetical protein